MKNKIENTIKVEVCCGSIEDVITADKNQVNRIELNSALELGGLTPTVGSLIESKKKTNLPICCMVRPRAAGFYYTEEQFSSMLYDAELLLKNNADGIVFGFLNQDNTIDTQRTKEMVSLIKKYNKEAIFHKAFDETPNLVKSAQQLIECKIDRVLTSGGLTYPNIEKGFPILKELIEKYNTKLTILVGGGVSEENVLDIIAKTNLSEIHMSAKHTVNDNGEYLEVSDTRLRNILEKISKNSAL